MGRALGVSRSQSLLIATGFSICGASAIKAMEGNADASDDEVYVAIALVTLFGSIAILLLPALQGPLGFDTRAFGAFVGASVHDVGQTVATANRVAGALPFAIVVKLTRVILLAPMVALVGTLRHKRGVHVEGSDRRPSIVPLFYRFRCGNSASNIESNSSFVPRRRKNSSTNSPRCSALRSRHRHSILKNASHRWTGPDPWYSLLGIDRHDRLFWCAFSESLTISFCLSNFRLADSKLDKGIWCHQAPIALLPPEHAGLSEVSTVADHRLSRKVQSSDLSAHRPFAVAPQRTGPPA